MADGYLFNQSLSFQKGMTSISCKVSIDENGDATLITANGISYGVFKVTHEGDGEYSVHLGISEGNYDLYSELLYCNVVPVYSGTPVVFGKPFYGESLTTIPNYIKLTFVAPTVTSGPVYSQVPTDPPEGTILLINAVLKRGTAN